jgi:uncharacterized protein (TIGR04141 family)
MNANPNFLAVKTLSVEYRHRIDGGGHMLEIKRVTLYKTKPGNGFADYLKGDLATYDHVVDDDHGFEGYIKFVKAGGKAKTEDEVPWLRFLNSGFPAKKYELIATNIFPRAIMAIKFAVEGKGDRHYVATFGQHADSMLDRNRIVYDFGIKVGMNICDTERLRRVQTTGHESISTQTERQASVGANLRVFGVNTESEFLRTISGYVKAEFNPIVESFRGRDSIAIKLPKEKNIAWSDLVSICRQLDEQYYSTAYKNTVFKVYDLLRHETDPQVVADLDDALCVKIAAKDFGKIHLSPPTFVESEEIDFCYQQHGDDDDPPPLFEDLRIADLVSVPRRRLKGLSVGTLKSWSIYEYNSEQDKAFLKWNAYECLVAEIELNGKTYVLSNGQWREISPELRNTVTTYFANHNLDVAAPYLPNGTNIYDAARKQNREEVYNRAVAAAEAAAFLFDKGKVKIAGQGLYEICDLFHLERHFVHVKRYSSGASSISHIFTQTKLYSHAFATDADTRKSVAEWIDASLEPENDGKDRAAFKLLSPHDSRIAEPDYTVIFCLLTEQPAFSISDLPFMSQYELMLTHRFLTQDRNYKVGVVFRQVQLGAAA